MPGPDVRVGIVSWNTAALLDRCLAVLPAALGDLDAEVVVVDNASQDDSVAVARRHGVDVVVNEVNLGYAVAMNQALDGSHAAVLIALNPDTEPPPGSLAALVDALHGHVDAGVVVPRLTGSGGEPQHSAYRWPTPAPSLVASLSTAGLRRGRVGQRFLLEGSGPHRTGPVPWAIGAVHVIRVEALQGEPPYSERSFMYAEDLELCWRLADRGWTTWLDGDVAVPHVGNAAGAQAWGEERSARYWTATYDVVASRRSPWAARLLGMGAWIASWIAIVRSLPGALVGRNRHHLRGLVRRLRSEARVHARVVLTGPPPPPLSPPASPRHP